jgi:hypothetical protein
MSSLRKVFILVTPRHVISQKVFSNVEHNKFIFLLFTPNLVSSPLTLMTVPFFYCLTPPSFFFPPAPNASPPFFVVSPTMLPAATNSSVSFSETLLSLPDLTLFRA